MLAEPDRLYRRHQVRTLGLAGVAFAASAPGQSFVISVFVDDFLAGTGISRPLFSGLYAGGTVVSAVAMLLLGRVVDRRGLRAAWFVVAAALALACGLASVATGVVVAFLALALLRTSGQGSFTLVGTLLVARTFERRRGQAIAVANLGVTASSILLPPLVALLILGTDWRVAYRVLGLVLLVVVLPLGLLVREGPPRRPTGPVGVAADGLTYPAATRPTRPGLPDLPSATAARLLLVLAAPPLIGTAVVFHATSILAERGLGYLAASTALGVLGGAAAVGVVAAGLLTDRMGTPRTLLLLSTVGVLAVTALLVPTSSTAYVAVVLLGLSQGSMGVVNGTVWARTFGTEGLGRIQGTAASSMITAAALAPLVPATSLAVTGSHTAGLLVLLGVAVAALVVAARLGLSRSGAPSPG